MVFIFMYWKNWNQISKTILFCDMYRGTTHNTRIYSVSRHIGWGPRIWYVRSLVRSYLIKILITYKIPVKSTKRTAKGRIEWGGETFRKFRDVFDGKTRIILMEARAIVNSPKSKLSRVFFSATWSLYVNFLVSVITASIYLIIVELQ